MRILSSMLVQKPKEGLPDDDVLNHRMRAVRISYILQFGSRNMMPMQRSEPKNIGAWLTDGVSMFGGEMVETTTDVAMIPPLKAVMTLKVQCKCLQSHRFSRGWLAKHSITPQNLRKKSIFRRRDSAVQLHCAVAFGLIPRTPTLCSLSTLFQFPLDLSDRTRGSQAALPFRWRP
jgi:hypothetical protein